jgi:hypothetical protein
MTSSLQYRFIESKGKPIDVEGQTVIQMDRVPIRAANVRIQFLKRTGKVPNGITIKSQKGHILLSDGEKVKGVNIWDQKDLPREVEHAVLCPDGQLLVWNIYHAIANEPLTRGEAWTGNAGMIIEKVSANKRRYRCSDGIGDFDPTDLVFELEWQESK